MSRGDWRDQGWAGVLCTLAFLFSYQGLGYIGGQPTGAKMTTEMGEVVTLQGGSATNWQERRDWSPIAQPPGSDDVIAHTPDPKAYHQVEGRVMLPRAKQGKGNFASQGFSTKPGIVHIDPADPVSGAGGLTVDLDGFNANQLAKAAEAGQGDPYRSWAMAAQMKQGSAQPAQAQQPQPQVQPQAQQQAAQAPTDGSRQMVPQGAPLASPSVKTTQGSPMSIPQPVPVDNPPQAAAHPQPPQPPQQQAPQQPPQQYQQPPQQYQPPPQQPYYPPPQPQPAQSDPAMMQVMQGMMGALQDLQSSLADLKHKPDPSVHIKEAASHTSMSPRPEEPKTKAPEPEYEGEPILATPEDTGLEFLTTPPSSPKVQVVFDLGKGGKHFKRFHHVAIHGKCLSMVFDSRYEGDQFIPPHTEEGDPPIQITFPQHKNKVVKALVPQDFNQRLGCLDQLNFIIVDDEQVTQSDHDELAQSLQS